MMKPFTLEWMVPDEKTNHDLPEAVTMNHGTENDNASVLRRAERQKKTRQDNCLVPDHTKSERKRSRLLPAKQ